MRLKLFDWMIRFALWMVGYKQIGRLHDKGLLSIFAKREGERFLKSLSGLATESQKRKG